MPAASWRDAEMCRDREEWPPGPWDDEPDACTWRYEPTGYTIAARRNPWGAWCAYVVLPPGHPLVGTSKDEARAWLLPRLGHRLEEQVGEEPGLPVLLAMLGGDVLPTPQMALNVHGGVTWTSAAEVLEGWEVNLALEPGSWLVGFDCGHSGDLPPWDVKEYGRRDPIVGRRHYRPLRYVVHEAERLAEQLWRVRHPTLGDLAAGARAAARLLPDKVRELWGRAMEETAA